MLKATKWVPGLAVSSNGNQGMFFASVSTGKTSLPGKGVDEGTNVAVGGKGDGVNVAVAGIGDEVTVGEEGIGVRACLGEHPAMRMSIRINVSGYFMYYFLGA